MPKIPMRLVLMFSLLIKRKQKYKLICQVYITTKSGSQALNPRIPYAKAPGLPWRVEGEDDGWQCTAWGLPGT